MSETKTIEQAALDKYRKILDPEDTIELQENINNQINRECFIAGGKHQKELSDAREKLLLDVIWEMMSALEYYKVNAMTFKHCDEVTPDVEEYCNGEIAEDTLSSVAKKLEGL